LAKIEENKIALEKKLLRTNLKNELQKFSQLELQEKSEKICKNILNCKFFIEAKNIFFFMPLKTEPNILSVIETSLLQNKNCYIPKVNSDGTMDFFKLDNKKTLINQVEIGNYNILEPKQELSKFEQELFSKDEFYSEKNIIFIPATAFDKNKNRIGKGKGFYDKFLAKIPLEHKDKTIFAGISFDIFIIDKIPVEPTDIKMDFIITDKKIY
jgi:5-formyltetrahydrofolate cyclo-ligase